MPRFHWNGPGQMERVDMTRTKAPEVEEPASPDAGVPDEKTRLAVCGVQDCGRRFKKNMILARHFNSAHEDLKEDKDSWREFAEEVWV